MKEITFKSNNGQYFINKKNVEFEEIEQFAKTTYCRAFNILMFPKISIQSKMLDNLQNCTLREYSICYIQHYETNTLHYHAVIHFTDSYNQKKSIWRVLKDLHLIPSIARHIDFDFREIFIDLLNHIKPSQSIDDSLLYLIHMTKGAVKDNKKPYKLDEVQIAENGNIFLYDRLENTYNKAIQSIDDVAFTQLDICNYLFDLVDCAAFNSQFELIDYIRKDKSLTIRQRSAVLNSLKNYIFAILEKIKKNT